MHEHAVYMPYRGLWRRVSIRKANDADDNMISQCHQGSNPLHLQEPPVGDGHVPGRCYKQMPAPLRFARPRSEEIG